MMVLGEEAASADSNATAAAAAVTLSVISDCMLAMITDRSAGRLKRARLGLPKARASATGPAAGDTRRDNASFSAQICPQGQHKEDVPPATASCITSDHTGRLKCARLGLPKARASATGPATGDS